MRRFARLVFLIVAAVSVGPLGSRTLLADYPACEGWAQWSLVDAGNTTLWSAYTPFYSTSNYATASACDYAEAGWILDYGHDACRDHSTGLDVIVSAEIYFDGNLIDSTSNLHEGCCAVWAYNCPTCSGEECGNGCSAAFESCSIDEDCCSGSCPQDTHTCQAG